MGSLYGCQVVRQSDELLRKITNIKKNESIITVEIEMSNKASKLTNKPKKYKSIYYSAEYKQPRQRYRNTNSLW